MSKYRQYILGSIFLLMVLYYVGEQFVGQMVRRPLEAAGQRTQQLQNAIEKRRKELAAARQAAQLLARWQSQALPADPELAQSLYQAWLVQLCDEVGLSNRSLNVGSPRTIGGQFQVLSFSVRGRGSLEQLMRMLFGFYQTDLLHQIRSISLTPLEQANQFDISISIEAAALPGAFANLRDTEQVVQEFTARTWRGSDRLAAKNLEDYRLAILGRNLFQFSAQPDPLDYTVLTSINSVNGQPEAWFNNRTNDQLLRLQRGETFEIGYFQGKVLEILESDVIVESDGQQWLISLGESIGQAAALPTE